MKTKPITTQEAMSAGKKVAANLLLDESERFKAKATELKAKAFDKGQANELDRRLIRDHEIRAETYKDAARIALQ